MDSVQRSVLLAAGRIARFAEVDLLRTLSGGSPHFEPQKDWAAVTEALAELKTFELVLSERQNAIIRALARDIEADLNRILAFFRGLNQRRLTEPEDALLAEVNGLLRQTQSGVAAHAADLKSTFSPGVAAASGDDAPSLPWSNPAQRCGIVFFAGVRGGAGQAALSLADEGKEIQEAVNATYKEHHGQLAVAEIVHDVKLDELIQKVVEHRPRIVHFAGHGVFRELRLFNAGGSASAFTENQARELFRALRERVRLLVLTACNSSAMAQTMAQENLVDYAVGAEGKLDDGVAIRFARNFYRHIGALGIAGVRRAFDLTMVPLRGQPSGGSLSLWSSPRPGGEAPPADRPPSPTIELVIANEPRDEGMCAELEKHLGLNPRLEIWSRRHVPPGSEFQREARKRLASAKIVLLLISVDLLDSGFWRSQWAPLRGRMERGEVRVLQVHLRNVDWQFTPFPDLEELPKRGPVESMKPASRGYVEVATKVGVLVHSLADFVETNTRLIEEIGREIGEPLDLSRFDQPPALDALLVRRPVRWIWARRPAIASGGESRDAVREDSRRSGGPGASVPRGVRVWRLFSSLPNYPKQFAPGASRLVTYRFVSARSDEDLAEFVSLSEAAADIHAMENTRRLNLYRRWYGINAQSFLLLQRQELGRASQTIGCSIVLPLTPDGQDGLRAGRRAVIDLGLEGQGKDIAGAGETAQCFLVDTWIVRDEFKTKHDHYGYALLLKHLSLFWNPELRTRVVLLVEPDNPEIYKLLYRSGFLGPRKTASGSDLYELIYPEGLLQNQLAEYQSILGSLVECRKWKVF